MPNYKTLYPSKWFRPEDVKPLGHLDVVIESIALEPVGPDREEKPVVSFRRQTKRLILNKTNADSVAAIVGTEDYEDWPGHAVRLIVARIEAAGKRMDAIRIEPVPTKTKAAPSGGSTKPVLDDSARLAKQRGSDVLAGAFEDEEEEVVS